MFPSVSQKNLILDIPFFASFSFVACHLTRWLWLDIVCYVMLHMEYLDDGWIIIAHKVNLTRNAYRATYTTIEQLFSWKMLPKATVCAYRIIQECDKDFNCFVESYYILICSFFSTVSLSTLSLLIRLLCFFQPTRQIIIIQSNKSIKHWNYLSQNSTGLIFHYESRS